MSRHPLEQHIGNARGRIAVWLDESEAIDLAHHFGPRDLAYTELLEAVERAYPRDPEADDSDERARP
jgi:hypothetical protein